MIIEKGCLMNSIAHYESHMVFFSSPQLLELEKVPLVSSGPKPTRSEVLHYYRRLADHFGLEVRQYEKVEEIQASEEGPCKVLTSKGNVYESKFVVLAIGTYDHPSLLGIPGEDLPKVSHYYGDPHFRFRQNVAVIGGSNSAVEAALELHRHGARVVLIHRGPTFSDAVKYWLRPDIENRIKEGSILAFFNATVSRIENDNIVVQKAGGETVLLENDFVFALTGYHADFEFLQKIGVVLDPETRKPLHDPATMETSVRRVYVAGVVAGGTEGNRLFIENTRFHAKLIFQDIERKLMLNSSDSAEDSST